MHIPFLMIAYRSSVHHTTKGSPCLMMFGREIDLPIDLIFGKPREEPMEVNSEYAYVLSESLAVIHNFARDHSTFNKCNKKRL